MNLEKIKELKAEIKDLAEKGRACWPMIQGRQGYKRYEAWVMKRSIGKGARYLLLQYAYFRGKPYRGLERIGRPENRIDVGWLASSMGEPVEKVKAWLEMPLLIAPKPGPPLFTAEELEAVKRDFDVKIAAAFRLPVGVATGPR